DRVGRGEVEDVEAHGGDQRQAPGGGGERAAPGWLRSLRARKHLVPGGEAGPLAVDPQGKWAGEGGSAPVRGAPHQRDRVWAFGLVQTGARRGTRAKLAGEGDQGALVGCRQALPLAALGHDRALFQVKAGVLTRLDPDA